MDKSNFPLITVIEFELSSTDMNQAASILGAPLHKCLHIPYRLIVSSMEALSGYLV